MDHKKMTIITINVRKIAWLFPQPCRERESQLFLVLQWTHFISSIFDSEGYSNSQQVVIYCITHKFTKVYR